MKYSATKLCVAIFICIGLSGLHAQQTILSASNDATSSQGTVSYSVGQIAFITKTGDGGTVSEGIQQPYEISYGTGIDEEKRIDLEYMMYPNPANSYVKLKIEKHKIRNLNYELYNVNGLLLKRMKIESEETTIPMNELVQATYFLMVTDNNKALKTFRIIKK